jgi:16S rRNA (cytidine1402-2'-O)-methyltransferase
VRRGSLEELAEWAADGVRGEITLVVAGASPHPTADADPAALAGQVAELEAAGTPRKAAIAAVATKAGIQKRQVYDAVHRKREAPASPPRQ